MAKRETVHITVTHPASGRSVTWRAMNRRSALKQARIEEAAGARVTVTAAGDASKGYARKVIYPKPGKCEAEG